MTHKPPLPQNYHSRVYTDLKSLLFQLNYTASESLANTLYHDKRHKKGVFAQASKEMRNFLINSYKKSGIFHVSHKALQENTEMPLLWNRKPENAKSSLIY